MPPFLLAFGRAVLVRLLTDPEIRDSVVSELRRMAADTTNADWDDAAVRRLEQAWDLIAPAVAGENRP